MSSDNKILSLNELNKSLSNSSKAVGSNESTSILPPRDEYTDSSSLKSQPFYDSSRKNLVQKNGSGVKNMDENKLLELYMEKIDKDQRELRENIKEREERVERQIAQSEARENERMKKIEQLIENQNNKVDALKDEIANKLEDDRKYRHSVNVAIVIGVVTTVVALVGIYYATVSTITSIISLNS